MSELVPSTCEECGTVLVLVSVIYVGFLISMYTQSRRDFWRRFRWRKSPPKQEGS